MKTSSLLSKISAEISTSKATKECHNAKGFFERAWKKKKYINQKYNLYNYIK